MFHLTRYQLLDLLSVVSVEVLVFGGLILLILFDREHVRQFWRRALVFGAIVFLLEVPVAAFSYVLLDRTIFDGGPGSPSREGIASFAMAVGLIAGLALLLAKIAWRGLVYVVAAAEWSRVRPEDGLHSVAPERRSARHPLLWSLLAGLAAAALSTMAFRALGVRLGDVITPTAPIAAQLGRFPYFVRILVGLLFGTTAALTEEMTFRGALQGFLLRVTRGSGSGIVLSNLLVTVLWASLHLLNTNTPAVKLAQIGLIGIVLGEMARRWGLNSSIAGHLGLNIASVLAGLVQS
jgi:CAAX prenyl protease-like protein